ncbi:MAG TPA: SpvB/TcaC N-terminal domain-containing protein [Acidobacteriaceae bacterium]|nr:SpvB/TcaC N-terminal domain-containing protein [Acidobacteriaceae bacterium]
MPENGRNSINAHSTLPGAGAVDGPEVMSGAASTVSSGENLRTQSLPSISLPKGGGAIKGLGEKFSVNPSNGSAGFSIPVPAGDGRSGFGPHLNLTYDSANGNGVYGFGWTLDTPGVTRKTDKGLPRYLDTEESDVFILSGSEDLVPVLNTHGVRESVTRQVFGTEYRIYTYRPRIEGTYARIERWVAIVTGNSHWRTISQENVTTLFGYDDLSRISDPADPKLTFAWRISRSWDDKGNLVLYDYVREDSAGLDTASAHETNRTASDRAAQTYLKTVRWVGDTPYLPDWSADAETPLPVQWMMKVVLDYGDHGANPPSPVADQPWTVRPDPFSTWRATFEVRTYRRVQRLLVFHNFPNEPTAGADCLVASLDLTYSDQQAPLDPRNPIYTFLTSVAHTGYHASGGQLVARSFPPLDFGYSSPVIGSEILELDRDSLGNLPEGIDERFRWLDLDGEGSPGILTTTEGGWWYKRNTGPDHLFVQPDGSLLARARFGPMEPVTAIPSRSDLTQGQQFIDLAGEGRQDLVALAEPDAGFYRRTDEYTFEPLKRFAFLPQFDWSDPNVRFIDLTGDGLADVLLTEDGLFTVYRSRGALGFAAAHSIHTPWDEEKGPKVVFADGTDTIFMADLTGDGLNDLVRVRNGETSYWPNKGYGRFAAKVSMDRAPRFAPEEAFDPRRIRLADIDGSGSADILYIGEDGVRVWFNQSGNTWSDPNTIGVFPSVDRLSTVQVLDLLGTGTACLVWSSSLPSVRAPLLYVDLMNGRKPHLMTTVRNNLGSETRVTYAPSTRFYVADAAAEKPWATRLPFPVQVVVRRESFDWIGRNRHVARLAYHHGYFDGFEREFRGFGMVEQWDSSEFRDDAAFLDSDVADFDNLSFSVPILTRTWFHTGAFRQAWTVSRQYAAEYWVEPALRPPNRAADAAAMTLPDSVIPDGLDALEMQEGYRALKGHPLRIEIYAEDGTPRALNPYSVAETNFTLTCLQRRGPNRHAVFAVAPRESLTFNYEQAADDPRVGHELVLETDAYGHPVRTLSVAYPRRVSNTPEDLTAQFQSMLAYDQTRLHIRGAETLYSNAIDDLTQWPDAYRTPTSAGVDTAEITGATPAVIGVGITNIFTFQEADDLWQAVWEGASDIAYEEIPAADVDGLGAPANVPTRRLIGRTRVLFRSDDLSGLLPQGEIQPLAISGQSYQSAFTQSQIDGMFGALVSGADLTAAGYVHLTGETGWWAPSTRVFFSEGANDPAAAELAAARTQFFLPRRAVDPFGGVSYIDWDVYGLLPTAAKDAVGNVTAATNDYRVLAPFTITDPNSNRVAVAFDALGLVTATVTMGPNGTVVGDSLAGLELDPDPATLAAFFVDPLAGGAVLIGKATMRFVYDLGAYQRSVSLAAQPAPPVVAALARETRASDLPEGQVSALQFALTYSDGFGREVQKKSRVADGLLLDGGPQVSPRWLGSGWIIYDEKGRPVRRYEPFFTATSAFEFAAKSGMATTLLYDPQGRGIGTLHPDQTWTKTVFDAWQQSMWDANDTVLIADPRTDADVGDAFSRAIGPEPYTSWYTSRSGGGRGVTQQTAANNAAAHAATPTATYFDSLGRACLVIADCGGGQRFPTRTALDTEGKPLAVFDAIGHRTEQHVLTQGGEAAPYIAGADMLGRQLYEINADAGARLALPDADGQPLRAWDARQHAFSIVRDAARRQTQRWVSTAGGKTVLIDLTLWGEGQDPAANLAGRIFRHYDMAGFTENAAFDYAGNLTSSRRQLATTWQSALDWSPLLGQIQGAALDIAAQNAGLIPTGDGGRDSFIQSTVWDALARPIQTVTPHTAMMKPNVLQPSYDAGAQLSAVNAWLQQAGPPPALLDPATADRQAVTAVSYNERVQRASIAFGNGVTSTYTYDAETFRLVRLVSTRPAGAFAPNELTVQDLAYVYDPVGNISHIQDDADIQNVIYFDNQRVEPSADYIYDPLYRLISATGREHLGQNGGALNAPQQVTNDDSARMNPPDPRDGNAMGNYTETYIYDAVGNLLSMKHEVKSGTWVRRYAYAEPSRILAGEPGNRLSATSLPGDLDAGPYSAVYPYNEHGSMTRMPHLQAMTWDEDERLHSTTRQAVNAGTPAVTWYVFGADGQRIRKISMASAAGAQPAAPTAERIYLGGVEVYREYSAAGKNIDLSRETLHIEAGHVVALVETRAIGEDGAPAQQLRYQHTNHLGSAVLELGDDAGIITYEEYFPYGSTSYQAVTSQTDVPKRYRYTGKERDAESDLYYHGARYYAPWLGRWTACDPAGFNDSTNLFLYSRGNPILFLDPNGTQAVQFLAFDEEVVEGHIEKDSLTQSLERVAASREAAYDHSLKEYNRVVNEPKGIDLIGESVFTATGAAFAGGAILLEGAAAIPGLIGGHLGGKLATEATKRLLPATTDSNIRDFVTGLAGEAGGLLGGALAAKSVGAGGRRAGAEPPAPEPLESETGSRSASGEFESRSLSDPAMSNEPKVIAENAVEVEVPKNIIKGARANRSRLSGTSASRAQAESLARQGVEVLSQEVSVRTGAGRRIIDIFAKIGDEYFNLESKTGAATRNRSQIAKDVSMGKLGGRVVGKNAPSDLRNQQVGKITTIVIHH